jgi:hypothetical protein
MNPNCPAFAGGWREELFEEREYLAKLLVGVG